MKQPQDSNTDIGLEEQNYIFKAWRDLKDSIFNVLYVLLDKQEDQEQQQPMYGLVFQSGLDYFQMLAFPFDQSIMDAWNGGETLNNVSKLFSKLNIMTYLPGVSFNTFLIMLYALIMLIILVLIDIIYVSYSFSKKRFKFTWPLVILAKLVPLFVTIFFLPITQTLLSVVRCSTQEGDGFQVMVSFPDVVCWKGWHLFHAAVTLLFVSLFVFISSVVALALFQPRMASKKLTARQNSTGQVVFIMNKIICQLIFSFNPFKDKWVYSLMLFCLSGWLYWTYNMSDPFYNKKVSKFFRIVSSYYFWTNFMLLVSQLLSPLGFNGGLVIWISGLPFIGIIIGFQHKSNIDQLFSFNLKFKSGQQLEGHLRYVLQLLQNQDEDKNSYMLITGYIQKHKEICVQDDCPLKMMKKLNKQHSQKEDLNQKFLLQIQRMYKSGIKKYPDCTRLRLSFAFFQLQRLKNKNKAYQQFSYALKTDPTFQQQFIIYRFKKIIRENLQNSDQQQNTTDLIEIIRFQNHISLCQQAMIRSARLHKDFWTQLKQETPNLKKLNLIGSKITKTINVVKQNYDQISKINNSVPQVLYCYSIYLLMVIKDSIQGKKMLEMSKKIYLQKKSLSNNKEQGDDMRQIKIQNAIQPVIQVSSKQGSIGKVLNFNSLFSQLSGYQRQEIMQRNFEKILPDIFKDVHEHKIKQWIQAEQPVGYINKNHQGYLKLKSGFIIPIDYQVFYKPSAQSFTVSFKNNSFYRHCCHFILDANKIIKETSVLGHAYFGLDKWTLSEKQVNIQDYFELEPIQTLHAKYNDASFETKIMFREKQIQCEMSISQVNMKLKECQEMGDTKQGQQKTYNIVQTNKLLGYYVKMTIKNGQKADSRIISRLHKHNQSAQQLYEQSSGSDIMSLYEDPNLFDILISNLAETKTKNDSQQRFKLKYKIKTMRLLNNEIKMVYDQNNNGDFDNNDHGQNEEDDLQIMKLNDDRYHQKIRSAINTKLDHQHVFKLKYVGVLFAILLLGVTVGQMVLSVNVFDSYYVKTSNLLSIATQSNYLSKCITATLDSNYNSTNLLNQIKDHVVTIQSPLNIQINLGNGMLESTTMRDGYLYYYSKIAEYFKVNGKINIDRLYSNYIQNIYPIIQNMDALNQNETQVYVILILCLFCSAFIISCTFLAIWLTICLKIDKKKSDILLWFLDIPISYVTYLGENCDNYLKTFMSIKQVMNKGVKIEEDVYIEDYHQVKGKQQEIQQQQKARKTLILKQRKLTNFSRLSCKHLKTSWVLLFGMVFSIIALSQSLALKNYQSFIMNQWLFSSKSVLWANSIHFSSYLLSSGRSNLNGVDVQSFHSQLLKKFENTISQNEIHNFNSGILVKENDPNYEKIVSTYTSVYFTDVCQYLDMTNTSCSVVADSSLRGGYRVYSMFIRKYEISRKQQIRQANQKYGSEAILSMMKIWKDSVKQQVDKATNLISILHYVYIFAGLLCFVIIWLLYLSKVNTEINEAIRMLNMIPFKLLSSSRKQTRSFIIWIIRQANKKKHEIQ